MVRLLLWLVTACFLSLPAPASDATDVDLGDAHGCAIYKSGEVYCWGDFPGTDTVLPFAAWKVEGLSPARRISVGRLGACAIDRKGALWCWGVDLQRSARHDKPVISVSPTLVEGLPPVTDVAFGYSHICAISEANGEVWCWGDNPCGELGCGDLEPRSEPTRVPWLNSAMGISAGVNNTCIVVRGGQLLCWGSDNPTMPHLEPFVYSSPDPLIFDESALGNLVTVSNGRNFACGIRFDGKVSCWGSNIMGQLGTSSPRLGISTEGIGEVDGIEAAEDIDASYFHACAVQAGDVICWGNDEPGLLEGPAGPKELHAFGAARRVGVGSLFSCAVVEKRIMCWGPETVGEHALLPGMSMTVAAPVPGLPGERGSASIERRLYVTHSEIEFLIEDGQPLEALRLINTVQEERSDESYFRELEIEAHFAAGYKAVHVDEDDEAALAHYSQAIALSAKPFTAALNNRAMILAGRGEFQSALADIDLALSESPDASLYHANKCLLLRETEDLHGATIECNSAINAVLPSDRANRAWIHLQRALTLRMSGDAKASVDDFVLSVEFAEASTVRLVQQSLASAGLYSGPVDGQSNDALNAAISVCVQNDECFEQASKQMGDLVEFLE